MVYNTQNYWVSGQCPSSENLNTTTHKVSDLSPSLGKRKETTTLLGPLERAKLNH
jgi:hypothetical protein